MPNLMKFLAITAAVLFTTTNAANAWYSLDANSSSVGSITVKIYDNASDACWTNLREAREYAEEKLEIEGYNVLAEDGEYDFIIDVNGSRDRGECFGNVVITIWAFSYRNGVGGFHQIGNQTGSIVDPDNFNTFVIGGISRLIGQM
jgi:hypothetical protein